MNCSCCHDNDMPRTCGLCTSPVMKGHFMVCALSLIANVSFVLGALALLAFWVLLARWFFWGIATPDVAGWVALAGSNAALLMLLSLLCSMRAKWLRHRIVSTMDAYLDDDGSCCGGACAGSCGNAECDCGATHGDDAEEGGSCCGPEGCGPGGCGNGQCCKTH